SSCAKKYSFLYMQFPGAPRRCFVKAPMNFTRIPAATVGSREKRLARIGKILPLVAVLGSETQPHVAGFRGASGWDRLEIAKQCEYGNVRRAGHAPYERLGPPASCDCIPGSRATGSDAEV